MKKRIFSIVLSLCMVLALIPATVFGAEAETFTITYEFDHGTLPADRQARETIEDGNSIDFPELENCGEYKLLGWMVKGADDDAIYTNEKDEYCPSKDMTFVAVYEEPVTLEVPFTTTVKQGGNVAPGKTVFTLELVDFQGKNLSSKDVIVTAAVTTNGVGSYDGTMTIKGTSEGITRMFTGPVFVKQADIDDSNWTVDGKVWGLVYKEAVALSTDDEIIPSPMAIFPATLITSENGSYYEIPDGAYKVKEMTFTNTYTKSIAEPSGNEGTTNGDSKTDADTNPKTGDDSNLTLWLTLLALSAAGAGGTCVYSRRRRSSRAK